MSLEHVYLYRWWHSDVGCSLICGHKMSASQEWVTCCQVGCVYENCMRIPFSKQYRYVTNHLHLYVTNYYIFVFTVTLLLLVVCLSLSMWRPPGHMSPYQHRSHGPIFNNDLEIWSLFGKKLEYGFGMNYMPFNVQFSNKKRKPGDT